MIEELHTGDTVKFLLDNTCGILLVIDYNVNLLNKKFINKAYGSYPEYKGFKYMFNKNNYEPKRLTFPMPIISCRFILVEKTNRSFRFAC